MMTLLIVLLLLALLVYSTSHWPNLSDSAVVIASPPIVFFIFLGVFGTGTLVSTDSSVEYLAPVNGYLINEEGRYVTTGNKFGQLTSSPISGGLPAKFEKDFVLLTITRKYKPNLWTWFPHTVVETKISSVKPPVLSETPKKSK